MPNNKLSDLRNHLFAALEGLSDPDNPLDLDRAKTICTVAQTLINTAKVEVEMVKALHIENTSSFFQVEGGAIAGAPSNAEPKNRLLEEANRSNPEIYFKKKSA